MNLFRNLLFWLLLAVAGALVAQLLVQDPGRVLVSFRGTDYAFTVVSGLLMLAACAAGGLAVVDDRDAAVPRLARLPQPAGAARA